MFLFLPDRPGEPVNLLNQRDNFVSVLQAAVTSIMETLIVCIKGLCRKNVTPTSACRTTSYNRNESILYSTYRHDCYLSRIVSAI